MNRYFLLSAAALLAGTSGAGAGRGVTNVSLDDQYCNDLKIVEPQRGVFAVRYENCGDASTGQGLARKTAQGKFVDLSDNYYGNYSSLTISYDLSLPLRTGGTWTLWVEFSGTSSFEANHGTYSVNAASRRTGGVNLMSSVKALIAAHRAARAAR